MKKKIIADENCKVCEGEGFVFQMTSPDDFESEECLCVTHTENCGFDTETLEEVNRLSQHND